MNRLWYKNSIIYSLSIQNFLDSNADGIGDIKGLTQRLPYLRSLNVNCIWLLPFFDSPKQDFGYDIRDYFQIDPQLGDFGDFSELVDTASELGIRIIIDLVANHTSVEHAWFQDARKSKESKYRDYYIWSDKKPKETRKHVMFGEKQGNSNWKYDDEAKAYFYHTFYEHQADLNITNPAVQEEIKRIMHFWLKLGISGFRMDAAAHLLREKGDQKFKEDPHQIIRDFRVFVEGHSKDAVLLAEVDVEPEKYQDFFGEEDQMHMLFNFYLNNYIWLALAEGSPKPLIKALKRFPKFSEKEQMANFLRNHDELDLDRLTETEKQKVFEVFAPKEDMRIYGRGIRRRIAPMLNGRRKKMELANSLLLTLPGTPVLRYGQEIGMGEDLSLEERNSVRTAMQWSDTENGGFSNAPTDGIKIDLISKGKYSFKKINVNNQEKDPASLLNWMIRATDIRSQCPEFGWGKYRLLSLDNENVLAIIYEADEAVAVALHNFSAENQKIKLRMDNIENLIDVFGNRKYKKIDPKSKEIELSPYGYRWLRMVNMEL